MLPDDQVHPDTHVLTMVNNVIGVVNYVIAARPSLLNFMIADTHAADGDHLQGAVELAVAEAVEAVPVGAAGGHRDRGGA